MLTDKTKEENEELKNNIDVLNNKIKRLNKENDDLKNNIKEVNDKSR